jgi:DNA recombination protein RmuC
MARYNETVGSYERSVLAAARRFDDLGVAENPVPAPPPLEATVRALRPVESAEPLEADAAAAPLGDTRDGTRGW